MSDAGPGRAARSAPAPIADFARLLNQHAMDYQHLQRDPQPSPRPAQPGPLIPSSPSALERIYVELALTASERKARYGEAVGEQGHHLEMARSIADGALVDAFLASVQTYGSYANEEQLFFDPRKALTPDHRPTEDDDLQSSSIACWLEECDAASMPR